MTACPCGSGRALGECCGPVIEGRLLAPTAEALMRSRYTAYVLGAIDYLTHSLHPEHRHDHDPVAARRWAERAVWEGLEVVDVQGGAEEDAEGRVEFVAAYREREVHKRHHEVGRFLKQEGAWYYVDGEMVADKTTRQAGPKVGRNEPCPCGSGKKYKKCCGASGS
jgi:SEC-C motif-containing protein